MKTYIKTCAYGIAHHTDRYITQRSNSSQVFVYTHIFFVSMCNVIRFNTVWLTLNPFIEYNIQKWNESFSRLRCCHFYRTSPRKPSSTTAKTNNVTAVNANAKPDTSQTHVNVAPITANPLVAIFTVFLSYENARSDLIIAVLWFYKRRKFVKNRNCR